MAAWKLITPSFAQPTGALCWRPPIVLRPRATRPWPSCARRIGFPIGSDSTNSWNELLVTCGRTLSCRCFYCAVRLLALELCFQLGDLFGFRLGELRLSGFLDGGQRFVEILQFRLGTSQRDQCFG